MDAQLKEAATAVRNGNNVKARQLLAEIIRCDPRNVRAWLLLSYAVEQKERQIECSRSGAMHFISRDIWPLKWPEIGDLLP